MNFKNKRIGGGGGYSCIKQQDNRKNKRLSCKIWHNLAFLLWVLAAFLMIVCVTTLAALNSSKTAIGVIRFKTPTPAELTNCVLGDNYDLFPALTSASNVGIAGQIYRPLTSGDTATKNSYGPYCFENLNMFENKTITKIVAPIYRINTTQNAYMTVFVISNQKGTFEIHKTYKLYATQNFIDSFNPVIGAWITFNDLNIKVSEGETLAFASYDDSLRTCYYSKKLTGRGFYGCGTEYVKNGQWWDLTENWSLMFDVYAYSDRLNTVLSSSILDDNEMSKLDGASSQIDGYVYSNLTLFSNKLITKIVAPIHSINTSVESKFWTINVIKATRGAFDIVRTYRIEMSDEQILNWNPNDKNKWVMFSNLNILVGEDETLAFTSSKDTVFLGYANSIVDENSTQTYYICKTNGDTKTWDEIANSSLLIDVYGQTGSSYLLMGNSIVDEHSTITKATTLNNHFIWRFDEETANRISGRVITKITVPICQIDSAVTTASDAYINLFVIDRKIDTTKGTENGEGVNQAEFLSDYLRSKHKLTLTTAQFKNFQEKSWITFDNLNIAVGADETIAFGCWDLGTMSIIYFDMDDDVERQMITTTWLGWKIAERYGSLPLDIYVARGDRYSSLLQSNSAKEIAKSKLVIDTQEYAVLNTLQSSGRFAYTNTSIFEKKTITKIVTPVYNITNELNAFLTVNIVDTSNGSIVKTYNLILTTNEVKKWKALQSADSSNKTCAEWLAFDELSIDVGVGQTLAFGASDDTISLLYSTKNTNTDRAFTSWANGQSYQTYNLLIDVYGYSQYSVTPLESLTEINEQEVFDLDISNTSDWVRLNVKSNADFVWMYGTNMFERTIINKIVLPVYEILNTTSAKCTLRIVNAEAENGAHSIIKSQELTIDASEISKFDSEKGSWVTFDNLDIRVKAGQTIAFGAQNDTIILAYYNGVKDSKFGIKTINGQYDFTSSLNLPIGFYGIKSVKSILKNKSMSILGDSISTYSGYNNNTKYNSTIGGNAVAYPAILPTLAVNDTWWMQTINELGMNLCVNNSWSGSHAYLAYGGVANASSAWGTRSVNLHNDNTGKQPDIITVFMGTNDFCQLGYPVNHNAVTDDLFTRIENGTLTTPSSFDEAYALMIYKMRQKYSSADIFCMTIHYAGFVENDADYKDSNGVINPTAVICEFNDIIKAIAEHYDCPVVDIYADSGINIETASIYTNDKIHPNAEGMDLITNCLVNKMADYYLG